MTPAAPPEGAPPGEGVSYAQPGFDDKGWRKLDLPHDWGVEGPFDQNLPGETGRLPWHGVAWYRKALDVSADDKGRQICLNVDGAMSYAAVWCNGQFVGGWPYGYASWQLDLTPFIKFGGGNVIAIRLDNPPESSRWYPGGGIYRNVWLVKTSPVHVAHWGNFISTLVVGKTSARLALKTLIANKTDAEVLVGVKTHVVPLNKNGGRMSASMISFPPATVKVPAGGEQPIESGMTLDNPKLWSIENPDLYVAVTTLEQDGKVVDQYETVFGIRTIEFTKDNGFLLNGERVPLNGVCDHHDLGALGAAFHTDAAERQLRILKEMGCNAIRTSHNPPAPELLDLCDRMGFVVMDEFVDCWKLRKKPNGYNLLFTDWAEADVRAYVRRDRNHPSVISLEHRQRNPRARQARGAAIGQARSRGHRVKLEDATRSTTIGVSDTRGGYNGFQTGVDVFGYNYKPGEYARFRAANPAIPLFGSETASCISSRGEYFFPVSNNKADGKFDFQMSSYDLFAPRLGDAARLGIQGPGRKSLSSPASLSGPASTTSASPRPTTTTAPTCSTTATPEARRRREGTQGAGQDARALAQQLLLRHHRPRRVSEGSLLPLPGALASRFSDGAHPPALELAGARRGGHARPRLHERRRGRAVPQRQVARPEEKGPIRIPPPLGRREIRAGRTQGRRLQERQTLGGERGENNRSGCEAGAGVRPPRNPDGRTGLGLRHRLHRGQGGPAGSEDEERAAFQGERPGGNRGNRQRRPARPPAPPSLLGEIYGVAPPFSFRPTPGAEGRSQ